MTHWTTVLSSGMIMASQLISDFLQKVYPRNYTIVIMLKPPNSCYPLEVTTTALSCSCNECNFNLNAISIST